MRDDRKCVHVQPNARTLNNHRRPPDLQMWLYQRECSPTPATHESFCSTRPSASASPHIVYTRFLVRQQYPAITTGGGKHVGSQISCHIPTEMAYARDI